MKKNMVKVKGVDIEKVYQAIDKFYREQGYEIYGVVSYGYTYLVNIKEREESGTVYADSYFGAKEAKEYFGEIEVILEPDGSIFAVWHGQLGGEKIKVY